MKKINDANFRFTLEGKSRAVVGNRPQKFSCPSCMVRKTFTRYVDRKTNQYLPEQYGICDRQNNCGYHLNPYADGYSSDDDTEWISIEKTPKPIVPLPYWVMKRTMDGGYNDNVFVQNLLHNVPFPFEYSDVMKVAHMYCLGTIRKGYLTGGTTFPYIDEKEQVRTIQAKTFTSYNHTDRTGNIHSILSKHYAENKPGWLIRYMSNERYFSCLFGAHLLKKYQDNAVILVEAPKTAIYGTLYFGFPDDGAPLWLAVYNLSSLSYDRCKVLEGRMVWLFPDLATNASAYNSWKEKADYFNQVMPGTKFITSDLLERIGTDKDRINGVDIADFLIQRDWRLFRLNRNFSQGLSSEANLMVEKNPLLRDFVRAFDLSQTNLNAL